MAPIHSTDLLRQLAGGIRPDGASPAAPRAPFDARSFEQLLAGVRVGGERTDRPLTIARGVQEPLSPAELDALAAATDAAEASGSQRLLAVIDQKAVTIDVLDRTIESVTADTGTRLVQDVDSVVFLPGAGAGQADLGALFAAPGAAASRAALGPGSLPISNASIASLLASFSTPRPGADTAQA